MPAHNPAGTSASDLNPHNVSSFQDTPLPHDNNNNDSTSTELKLQSSKRSYDSILEESTAQNDNNKSPLAKLLLSKSLASSTTSLSSLTLSRTNDSIISNDSINPPNDQTQLYETTDLFNDYFHLTQFTPQTTSILKPGSRFIGSQQSGRSTYEVEVELKYVDLSKSYLNGYLKIQGLTESHPEIITFFESEIISEKYSFFTEEQDNATSNSMGWGSTSDEIDIQHWSKFQNWRNKLPTKKIISKNYIHKDFLKFENIYMRWKEKFLVPDHKIDNIEGASYAGFYYINFNQLTGNITGLYYHKSSEKFQQLELSYVEDDGVHGTYKFQ